MWPASLRKLSFGSNSSSLLSLEISGQSACNRYRWAPLLSSQQLLLLVGFDQRADEIVWPASLELLSFGYSFDRPVALELLCGRSISSRSCSETALTDPSLELCGLHITSPQRLSFGSMTPLRGFVWPASRQRQTFGESFMSPWKTLLGRTSCRGPS